MDTPGISSSGEIARSLNQPIHRVDYVIRTRQIEPLLCAGGRKLYGAQAVQQISSELRRIDKEREGASGV